MESRMDKYYHEDDDLNMQRSSKNAKLYREVYSDYNDLENLPIPDNTNEIDIPELKRIMQAGKDNTNKTREKKYDENIIKDDSGLNKIHDINKLLEYAKNENNKLKENNHSSINNYKFLETLENKTITEADLNYVNDDENDIESEDMLTKTREIKYQTKKISDNPVIEQIIPEDSKEFNTASLSLDILSDLKPSGDTGVTEPVKDPAFEKIYDDRESTKEEIKEDSDSDIDIIKNDINSEDDEKDSSFYTDLYKFSNKDFEDDEDDDESRGSLILKIILLIIFIGICGFAIYYFITNYGFN